MIDVYEYRQEHDRLSHAVNDSIHAAMRNDTHCWDDLIRVVHDLVELTRPDNPCNPHPAYRSANRTIEEMEKPWLRYPHQDRS